MKHAYDKQMKIARFHESVRVRPINNHDAWVLKQNKSKKTIASMYFFSLKKAISSMKIHVRYVQIILNKAQYRRL